jgi:hypothetical protein
MKVASKSSAHAVKTGSVTLTEARQAARAAKTGRMVKPIADRAPSARARIIERYLGHFGPVLKKATARKSTSKKVGSAAKKSAAKKVSARKRG